MFSKDSKEITLEMNQDILGVMEVILTILKLHVLFLLLVFVILRLENNFTLILFLLK